MGDCSFQPLAKSKGVHREVEFEGSRRQSSDPMNTNIIRHRLVNTVRHQLKQEGIRSGWREIVRTMNTQKVVTTLAQNNHGEVIMIRRCSGPNQQVRKLYDALKYKYAPFVKRKYVVHKSELENCQFIEQQEFHSD